ncbi:alanine--glyoxylate aminotransferase family protein [Thermomicrobium sp. CFH 73360]|uniref:pyridoxal-phosphate-dependent aminotransferase family protein n=1 Tax=Thermomicrobium sp. CFH 73360 TaxID=2951987 RepID=UPI002076A2F7|nr:alanine--glyoxylate aminotransferase family protein [Thermomicrobium sp. CFH 73360]
MAQERADRERTIRNLRIAGPTPLPPAVLAAMQRPMVPHRGVWFRGFVKALLGRLRVLHRTDGEVFVLPGTGSAGWEIAIVNLLVPGDRILLLVNGDFGERWWRVAERYGVELIVRQIPYGRAFRAEQVARWLEECRGVRAVFIVYNETSTGVTNPLPEISAVVRSAGALLAVDGVSAVGGLPLEMDAWGIDLIFSGSQKAWMCPPGLVIVGVGPRAWEAVERAGFPRAFWDLREYRTAARSGDLPSTAPISLLYALDAAVGLIEAERLENVWRRHQELAAWFRMAAQELGLRCFAEPGYESATVTALEPPPGIGADELVTRLEEQHGIAVNGGQGRLKGKIIRVGHMGWVQRSDLEEVVQALARELQASVSWRCL